jgi:hypothetical protein
MGTATTFSITYMIVIETASGASAIEMTVSVASPARTSGRAVSAKPNNLLVQVFAGCQFELKRRSLIAATVAALWAATAGW